MIQPNPESTWGAEPNGLTTLASFPTLRGGASHRRGRDCTVRILSRYCKGPDPSAPQCSPRWEGASKGDEALICLNTWSCRRCRSLTVARLVRESGRGKAAGSSTEEARKTPGSPASAPAWSAHPSVVTAAAAGVAAAAAVVLALIPAAQFAYAAPGLDVMIETTGDLIALLVACWSRISSLAASAQPPTGRFHPRVRPRSARRLGFPVSRSGGASAGDSRCGPVGARDRRVAGSGPARGRSLHAGDEAPPCHPGPRSPC